MNVRWLGKLRELMGGTSRAVTPAEKDRSSYERFAIPHSFKPKMSVADAVVASLIAFVRICAGSVIFAFWGVGTLLAWGDISNPLLRIAAIALLLLLFAAVSGLALLATAALGRTFRRGGSAKK